MQNQGTTFVSLLDTDGNTSALYGVSSTPVKFLIDKNGNMVGAALGYKEWDSDQIKELIQALIDSG